MKAFFSKSVPLYIMVISMITFSAIYQFFQPKPDWEEFALFLSACDRYYEAPSLERASDVLGVNIKEMEALYVAVYGVIPGPISGELRRIKERSKNYARKE